MRLGLAIAIALRAAVLPASLAIAAQSIQLDQARADQSRPDQVPLKLAARGSRANAKSSSHKPAGGPRRQIYPAGSHIQYSGNIGARGIPAYVLSAAGTKRGFLIRGPVEGWGSTVGLTDGDVVLSINSHIVQTARELDAALARESPGTVRVVFVRQGDSELEMYTVNANAPAMSAAESGSAGGGIVAEAKSPLGNPQVNPNSAAAIPSCEKYMVELINHDRAVNGGVAPVVQDQQLSALARSYAEEMARGEFFAHVAPDGRGPQERARAAGIKSGVYENIAWKRGTGRHMQELVAMSEQDMMNEPPNQMNHRYNILDRKHQKVGVGIAIGKDGRVISVQEFSD